MRNQGNSLLSHPNAPTCISIVVLLIIVGILFHEYSLDLLKIIFEEKTSVIIRNYALIIGGFLGLYLAIKRVKITESGQITDRYSKAIEQLGDRENVSVRIGGLYALQRIAKDSEADLPTIQNVIANFIRRPPYKVIEVTEDSHSEDVPKHRDCPDLHVAIEIFQSLRSEKYPLPHLQRSNLSFFDLQKINFSGLNMDQSSFDHSFLAQVSFDNCQLQFANFSYSDLTEVTIKNSNIFRGIFSNSITRWNYFKNSNLQATFWTNCQLESAVFQLCNLNLAHLSDSHLKYTDFKNSHISWVDFPGNISEAKCRFEGSWAWDDRIPEAFPNTINIDIVPKDHRSDDFYETYFTPPPEWNRDNVDSRSGRE